MLRAGIVGLPNVGKSTLFNGLTRSRKAQAQNYPFCTIDPNVGVVEVPDDRLAVLAKLSKSKKIIPAAIEIVDIAGLVAGANKGEGLGNKFLANIREVDAIIHVVRCFENTNIIHSSGAVDPIQDVEIINTELLLADLQSVESQLDKNLKRAKSNDKIAKKNVELLEMLVEHLGKGFPATSLKLNKDDLAMLKTFNLLTSKPVIFACNVDESSILKGEQSSRLVDALKSHIAKYENCSYCVICAQAESDMYDLDPEEIQSFFQDCGMVDSGIGTLIKNIYEILGLASFFTTGEDETRAWTFTNGMKAPQCAGVIHSDFELGFIKAEVVSYDDLVACHSWAGARESGKMRLEGKEYLFADGDVTVFRFNK